MTRLGKAITSACLALLAQPVLPRKQLGPIQGLG